MADRKRKGKAVATSSNQALPRFKTLYHEAHFNSMLSARRILPELILQPNEDVLNPIRYQIYNRKWEKFTKPIQAVGHLMVKEFYANAWEPDKAKRKHPTYTSNAKIRAIPNDTLTPQEPPIVTEAMVRTREPRAKNTRQARQATPPQQHPQQPPQFQQQQDFSSSFYTHFDTSMSQLQRRLDQQHEENRRSFEAINTRMDRMDDQLIFLCYSNQMANEQMLSPYQNTARQFKDWRCKESP
ncbi:hypothetical protein PIB30_091335 [Stylosanthes scabra]|uniref:Uncharacterized protein n=1 Tax=Stylosanthes scabra TaxID=79078 RepID=A0ABU6SUX8_9FABA|nr:hypothetical protein [Stylosanthes scabra]